MADTNISNIDIKTHLHYWIQPKIHPSSSHPPTFGFPASVSWSASLTLAWDKKRCEDRIIPNRCLCKWVNLCKRNMLNSCWTNLEVTCCTPKNTCLKWLQSHPILFSSPTPLAVPDLYWPVRICSWKLYEIVTSKYLYYLYNSLHIFTCLYHPTVQWSKAIPCHFHKASLSSSRSFTFVLAWQAERMNSWAHKCAWLSVGRAQ